MNWMEPLRSPNPYTTPRAALDPDSDVEVLAGLGQRLAGRLVDVGLYYAVAVPMIFAVGPADLVRILGESGGDPYTLYTGSLPGMATGAASLALSMLNWYLIATRGQTIGKRVARTRIVRVDGTPAGFLHGVALRNWLLAVPSYVALLSGYAGVSSIAVTIGTALAGWTIAASYLLIFGPDRRCGHDYLAGTRVVRAASTA